MTVEEVKTECEQNGLVFQGVQPGVPELNLEALVLFARTWKGTTKALPISQFNAHAALARIGAAQ
jgi:hypothetical protein